MYFPLLQFYWKRNETKFRLHSNVSVELFSYRVQFINKFYWNVYIVTNQQWHCILYLWSTRSLWTNNNKNQCWFLVFCTHTHTHIYTHLKLRYKLPKCECECACVNVYSSGLLLIESDMLFSSNLNLNLEWKIKHMILWITWGYLRVYLFLSSYGNPLSNNISNPFSSFKISNRKCCMMG